MKGLNEKTPESNECKRKVRLQKQGEQSRARLACETKEQLHPETRKGGEQSRLAETGKEVQKRLKGERQRDTSRRQYKQSNKGLVGFWMKAKVMFAEN